MSDDKQRFILTSLRQAVGRRYGQRLETSTDFSRLSQAIADEKVGYISVSTLKRLWGYVHDNYTTKRPATLDILARYAGFDSFNAYASAFDNSEIVFSDYNSAISLDVMTLLAGARIEIRWYPDRCLTVTYKGDFTFTVDSSENSKLTPGTSFRCMTLIKGQPLIISIIPTAPDATSLSFVAGKANGIDWQLL